MWRSEAPGLGARAGELGLGGRQGELRAAPTLAGAEAPSVRTGPLNHVGGESLGHLLSFGGVSPGVAFVQLSLRAGLSRA